MRRRLAHHPILSLATTVAPGPEWLQLDLLGRLLLAAVLGAAVGLERESAGKEAGLRTTILICVGAALLTNLSSALAAGPGADPTRITAQIVTGIGFLGAGVILHHRGHTHGLTTAATIWVVSAIGIAAGGRRYVAAIGATLLVLIILVPLRWWEQRLEKRRRDVSAQG